MGCRPPRHVRGANTGQSPDGYPIALFLSRVVIFGRGQGGGGAGVDCCYSGTIKGGLAEPRGCKVGSCWPWGRPEVLCQRLSEDKRAET